ncbi:MAG: hypothetical protein QXH20_07405 [Candidatus Bathyarchaeia archaeon]
MKEIAKLIVSLVGIFSIINIINSLPFIVNIMNYSVRISQGDYNATQEMVKEVAEEITSQAVWEVIKCLLIALFSILGLTGLVKVLKNL